MVILPPGTTVTGDAIVVSVASITFARVTTPEAPAVPPTVICRAPAVAAVRLKLVKL